MVLGERLGLGEPLYHFKTHPKLVGNLSHPLQTEKMGEKIHKYKGIDHICESEGDWTCHSPSLSRLVLGYFLKPC